MQRGSDDQSSSHTFFWGEASQGRFYQESVQLEGVFTNLDVPYCVAARSMARLRCTLRSYGFSTLGLDAHPWNGDEPSKLYHSINKVPSVSEDKLAPASAARRGDESVKFFQTTQYQRR